MLKYSAARSATARGRGAPRSPFGCRSLPLAVVVVACAVFATPCLGTEPAAKGTTDRQARDETVAAIPIQQMNAESQAKVRSVLTGHSVYRRLPVQVIDADPDLYVHLLENPEIVVGIWDLMGISQLAVQRTGETTFDATDGVGTTGTMEFLYRDPNMHIIYLDGLYEGSLFQRALRGKCLLVVRSGYVRETNGRFYVTTQVDTFLHLENLGLELIAKTLQPLIGKVADHNLKETASFVASLSRTAEINSAGVQRLAARLTEVDPKTRALFCTLARNVSENTSAAAPTSPRLVQPAAAHALTALPASARLE